MGYQVDMEINVSIHKSQKSKFFKIMQELSNQQQKKGGGFSSGKKHYSWVDDNYHETKSVEEAFDCWRYEVELVEEYYRVVCFNGEKLGDDDFFWKSLAPIIEDGSVIDCTGEDNAVWRWQFNHGVMKEVSGKVIFEDEVPDELDVLIKTVDKADPYKLLGVTKKSTKEEVEKAYKKQVVQYHPDKVSHLAKEFQILAEKKTKELNEARNFILSKV